MQRKKTAESLPEIGAPMLAQIGTGIPPTDASGSTRSNGTASAPSATSMTAGSGWFRATAIVMDRQYPELSILPHHFKAKTAIVDGEIAI